MTDHDQLIQMAADGEIETLIDSRGLHQLALLIWQQFGGSLDQAHAAWCRMTEDTGECPRKIFALLVQHGIQQSTDQRVQGLTFLRLPMSRRRELDEHCTTVVMTTARFLELAGEPGDRPMSLPRQWRPEEIPTWPEWPFLELDPETGQVFGHEGRHRVAAMAAAEINRIEVIWKLGPDPTRDLSMEATLAWRWNGQTPEISMLKPQANWSAYHA